MITYFMDFAWQSFVEPDPGSELQGVVGYLHPSRYRTVPRVLWHTREIEAQLAESGGLVGYALRANLARKEFWAVAAWESDESLQNFVESNPHAEIRMALKREMEESWFQRFDVSGEEVPLNIDEALKRV
jgi:heme-degrading monooxygenase HmoA